MANDGQGVVGTHHGMWDRGGPILAQGHNPWGTLPVGEHTGGIPIPCYSL
jgi:hypothetical protein